MPTESTSLLSALLALAATFLGLSILVQIIQEVWKYLTSSKSKAYEMVLADTLGPWVQQVFRPAVSADLQVRGPGQLWRRRPRGRIQPLGKEQFLEALERTLPPWYQRTLRALSLEVRLGAATAGRPSPSWNHFVGDLLTTHPDSPGYNNVQDILRFVARWAGVKEARLHDPIANLKAGDFKFSERFSPVAMLEAFRVEFLPQVVNAERRYEQLTRNLEFAYKRRNLRQTFTFSMLIALFLNLPIERLYRRVSAVSPAEAITIAERATALYEQQRGDTAATDSLTRQRIEHVARQALEAARAGDFPVDYAINVAFIRHLWAEGKAWALLRYVAGCLVTALFTSFGAPFWNDIAGTLLRLQKGQPASSKPAEGES